MNINSLLIIFCKLDYHFKTSLVDVTMGFGPTGKIERVQCKVCKKIFVKKNYFPNLNKELLLIIIIILLIITFIV